MRVAPSSSRPTKRPSGAGSPGPWQPLRRSRTCINRPMASAPSCSRTTSEMVGLVGLVPLLGPFSQLEGSPPGGPSTPELGLYWALSPESRGNGYATEAAAALCRALFSELNPRRLLATTEHTNTDSQAVMRRLGMRMLTNPASRAGLAAGRGSPRLCACSRPLSVVATTSRRQGSTSAAPRPVRAATRAVVPASLRPGEA